MQTHAVPLTTFLSVVEWRYVVTALVLLAGTVLTEELYGRFRGVAASPLDAQSMPVAALQD